MFDSMEIQCKQSIRLCLMCQGEVCYSANFNHKLYASVYFCIFIQDETNQSKPQKKQSICFNWCTYANAEVSIIWGPTTFSMLLSEIGWNNFSAPDKKITLLARLSCVMSCQCAKNPNGPFSLQLLLIVGVGDVWRQGQLCKRNGDDNEDYLVIPTWQKPQRFLPVAAA